MSARYSSGSRGIDLRPALVDAADEVGVPLDVRLDQIDLPIKQLLERLPQAEVAIRMIRRAHLRKRDEKVQVAGVRLEVATGGGAEDLEAADAIFLAQPPQLVALLFDQSDHA